MKTNTIIQGDCLEQLKKLPDDSINCCMTSPPYWALRDYGVDKQLGLEPTFEEYINKLCDIFDEVKRVLRKDGTCWVNIGDTYCGGHAGGSTHPKGSSVVEKGGVPQHTKKGRPAGNLGNTYTEKCLIMIPFRFAIEMQNRGWILRNVIIWHKPNCMPSSVKDRFTVDFEYIFFFVKNKKYWFETQYEPSVDKESYTGRKQRYSLSIDNIDPKHNAMKGFKKNTGKCYPNRNKRTVWRICPKPFKEAHFAVYPEELCETPIKAGCPEFVCNKCSNPKILEIKREVIHNRVNKRKDANVRPDNYERIPNDWKPKEEKILGYKPTCKCNSGFSGGIVLDPFFGAGTTGLVALKQNKQFIGIELNPEYIEIAKARLKPLLEQEKLL